MARARNIKPSFFKNEMLVELPFEARLLFIGLWTLADRDGRLEDRPKRIKMEVFPADNVDVDKCLTLLQKAKFITRYKVEDCQYIQVDNFAKHQTPHIKEQESTIPAPDMHGANTVHAPPDSLNPSLLNPDIPSTPMSGSPDVSPQKSEFKATAIRVIDFLNLKTGKAYKPVTANLDLIVARLKDGATEQDCKSVIARKVRDWADDDKMREYLRPATLFNREKFAQYQGQLVAPANPWDGAK